jgi:hypothetical protein
MDLQPERQPGLGDIRVRSTQIPRTATPAKKNNHDLKIPRATEGYSRASVAISN